MMVPEEKIPLKSDRTASRTVGLESVIILLDRQETIVLNETGTRIWELMDAKKNTSELAQMIASEFDIEDTQALNDINEFIEDLTQRGAVLFRGYEA